MKRFFLTLVAVICLLVLSNIPMTSAIAADLATLLPNDVKIVAPSPDLPKELAAFSGRFDGQWDGYLASILIIEEINGKEARVIYAVDDQPRYNIKASCKRYIAKVITGKKPGIEFTSEGGANFSFSFEIKKDLNTLEGFRFRHYGGTDSKNYAKMKRVN